MHKGRLEAFSDGVIAIIITIMVLEMRTPHGNDAAALRALASSLSGYLISFVFLGIYWNNHHHLMQAVHHVDGRVLWANLHLLFWLSLVPLFTGWVDESHFAPLPVALYGAVFLLAGFAYFLLTRALLAKHAPDSPLAVAVGRDFKGKISLVLYGLAIPVAFWNTLAAYLLYVLVAVIWFVPDRRMERALNM